MIVKSFTIDAGNSIVYLPLDFLAVYTLPFSLFVAVTIVAVLSDSTLYLSLSAVTVPLDATVTLMLRVAPVEFLTAFTLYSVPAFSSVTVTVYSPLY